MEKQFYKFLLLFAVVLTMGFATSSCGGDDDEPSASVGKVSILNSSTFTVNNFQVIFVNDKMEIITRESKGTLKPKDKVNVDIPIGATEYYMGGVMYNTVFFSANYKVSVTNQVLTDQTVGQWTTNE
ncbi:MAG: hypothetical protein NC102_06065 [Clostridium sp.]|nr:hypothetical protein [Clostridium sp.]